MSPDVKKEPQIAPDAPSLDDSLRLWLETDDLRRRVTIRLRVRGGMPSQHYLFEFEASGDGTMRSRLECRVSGRTGETTSATISQQGFAALLRQVVAALGMAQEQPRFLPDTVIGVLEVSDGVTTRRIYFAADPEQAKTQGLTLPAELRRAVDAIYALGAKQLRMRSVKP